VATYAYLRISTDNKGQTTDNQRLLLTTAGFAIDEFIAGGGVSASTKAFERPAFSRMATKMVSGDSCIVVAVDRLGRSASDILNVVEEFKRLGIKLRVLQFDGMDITSSMGKMVLTCMAAMAELERNILIERTVAGLERTKAQGTKLGPPLTIPPQVLTNMLDKKQEGATLDSLAGEFGVPRNTIHRNLKAWTGKMEAYASEWEARQSQYNR